MNLRWFRKVAQSQVQWAEPSITRTSSNPSYSAETHNLRCAVRMHLRLACDAA
jgi:hypothetical protein